MTDLIRAICEAENSGEIDLNTRDSMIDIISEAKNPEYINAKVLKEEINKLIKERDEVRKELEKMVSRNVTVYTDDGKPGYIGGHGLGKHVVGNGKSVGIIKTSNWDKSKKSPAEYKKLLKKHDELNKKIKMYLRSGEITGLPVVESADIIADYIYEAELCGEITAEERRFLIGYLESKI